MERITAKTLRAVARGLVRELHGDIPEYPNKGSYVVDVGSAMYGRSWALCRIVNDMGGQTVILSAGTARELYNAMHAFRAGVRAARETKHC